MDLAGVIITATGWLGAMLFALLAWFSRREVVRLDKTLNDYGDRIGRVEHRAMRHETLYEYWERASNGLQLAIDNNTETMARLREAVSNVGAQIEYQVKETYRLRDTTEKLSDRVTVLEAR